MNATKKPNRAPGFAKTPALSPAAAAEALINNPAVEKFMDSKSDAANTVAVAAAALAEPELPKPATKEKSATKAKPELPAADYPWMNDAGDMKVQHIVRIPVQLKQLLDYLGQTTYSETMTSICVRGITHATEELAKTKGLPLPKNFGDWNKK